MNPELINVVTAGAAAAGYAVGLVTERIAVNKAAENQQPMSELMQRAAQAAEGDTSRWARIGNRVVAPLALGGAVALGMNVYAWAPENQAVIKQPALLEVVVDRSGATDFSVEGTPVSAEIDKLVSQVNGLDNIKSEAIVAHLGILSYKTLDQVPSVEPLGDAKLADATTQALSKAAAAVPVANGDTFKRNAAVIVFTNGNDIGKVSSVVTASQQSYGPKNPTPVFVVNVEGDKAGPKVAADLKAIAQKTGAQYWSAGSSNFESVAKDVQAAIVASEQTGDASTNKWPLRGLGLVSLAGLAVGFTRRGKEPFGRGIKGE